MQMTDVCDKLEANRNKWEADLPSYTKSGHCTNSLVGFLTMQRSLWLRFQSSNLHADTADKAGL